MTSRALSILVIPTTMYISSGFLISALRILRARHKLFHPYLDSFSVLQIAQNLDSPVEVTAGSMKLLCEIGKYSDYAMKRKLADDLHVTERSVERGATQLLSAELIEKPSPHAGRYRLSENLRNFFNWYRAHMA